MAMEALPEIGEMVKCVAADLELTTIRAEQGWQAFAKAAGRKHGESGHLAAFLLRTDDEISALRSRRQKDIEEWRTSPKFAQDILRIKARADRAERWSAGPTTTS